MKARISSNVKKAEELINADTLMNDFVKMPIDEFIAVIKEQELTPLLNMSKHFELTFQQLVALKESLLKLYDNGNTEDDKLRETIQNIYVCMQSIEDRHKVVTEIIKARKLS